MRPYRERKRKRVPTLQDIAAAIDEFPTRYETREGEKVTARRPSEVGSVLSRRFRGASRMDANDFRELGARVVIATYIQSATPTGKWCDVVVRPEVCDRCEILIRPKGDHLCGDCGRAI